ncbi:hypothetical protein FPV67DRAFT_1619269 [Lyophyllum atratum]|nr:hypothetical protein FPV67DRAFT_1619269 [Lyophyllum atratum]
MSNGQLRERLKEVEQDLKDVTLERLNVSRALARLRVHQDTWKHILDLVGTQDVPALHRIFKNSKRRSWSAEHLLEKIKMALAGDYRARSYSDLEIELATVVYELGGDAALHALHNSPFVFPCRNTLLEHRREFRLHITVGAITMSDILANIGIMFADVKPGHSRAGITLSMDEIASDGRLCYLTMTDEIAGLCEHAATELSSLKMGTNLNVVRAVRQALQEGKIHVGQEVFVAAFARNDEEGYGARPVLLIPTCKRGSFRDSALVMEMLRQAWKISPYGESLHGPIWSIASDGDPKRRPALYLHCMTRELRPTDPLFQHLENLPGMNVWTGPNGETQDLDYKHCFKRLCKLLCAREGILIGDVIINKSLLALWFERLTDVDWSKNSIYSLLNSDSSISERIHALLSPKDAQDVPRAIKLLNITADIRNLDNSAFDPSEQNTHRALSLLGEMLDCAPEQ